jgi:hypothetical protein
MVACLESLAFANINNTIRSAASLILEESEIVKDGEFYAKTESFNSQRSYAMKASHRTQLLTAIDSPCA